MSDCISRIYIIPDCRSCKKRDYNTYCECNNIYEKELQDSDEYKNTFAYKIKELKDAFEDLKSSIKQSLKGIFK